MMMDTSLMVSSHVRVEYWKFGKLKRPKNLTIDLF